MNEKIAALKSELALLKEQFTKKITDAEIRLKNMIEQESLDTSVERGYKIQASFEEPADSLLTYWT